MHGTTVHQKVFAKPALAKVRATAEGKSLRQLPTAIDSTWFRKQINVPTRAGKKQAIIRRASTGSVAASRAIIGSAMCQRNRLTASSPLKPTGEKLSSETE